MKPSILVTAALILAVTIGGAEVRTFTSSAGTTLRGELVSVKGDTVTLKKEDGTPLTLKLAAFSRVDQAWLQTQNTAAPAGTSASDPSKATKDAPFVNSLGMKFVPVPGTNVLFANMLVSVTQFDACAKETPGMRPEDGGLGGTEVPANEVSYDQAKGFCEWLSKKEGISYRLPTDREWSSAIGISSQESVSATPEELDRKLQGVYPWGSSWPPPAGFANYCDESYREYCKKNGFEGGPHIKGYRDGEYAISLISTFKPNRLGIHDMSGNLMQWCDGWYDKLQTRRFLRGSMWGEADKSDLLSSARRPLDMGQNTKKDIASGIRVVLELPRP